MSWLGTVLGIANVGVGLLNSVLGGGASLSDDDSEYHYVLDNGKHIRLLAYYVAVAEDKSIVGKDFAVMKPSLRSKKGMAAAPIIPSDVVAFTQYTDSTGTTTTSAANTSTSSDYWIFWALTLPNGNTENNQTFLPAATNTYKPDLVDVTAYYNTYITGHIAVTAAQIYPQPYVMEMLKVNGISADTVDPDTLLGNFHVNSVFSAVVYFLYTTTDSTGNITGSIKWTWITPNSLDSTSDDYTITGAQVTSTVAYETVITGTVNWENPSNAFTVNFTANPASVNGGITTIDFPPTDKPLIFADISAVQPGSSSVESKRLLAEFAKTESYKGNVKKIKYMIV